MKMRKVRAPSEKMPDNNREQFSSCINKRILTQVKGSFKLAQPELRQKVQQKKYRLSLAGKGEKAV